MLDSLSEGSSEAEILKRISIARGAAEPDQVPTEALDAVEVSDEAPEEADEGESIYSVESEESAEPLEVGEVEEESEALFIDLDGEEISLDDIREWKSGNLRQADYTKKTTEVADRRKALEAKEAELSERASQMNAQISALESMLTEEFSGIDWDDLLENDTTEYLIKKERLAKRQLAIDDAKKGASSVVAQASQERIGDERAKLFSAVPEWSDAEKQKADLALISQYTDQVGYSSADIEGMLDHRQWLTLLDAARYRAQAKKGSAVKKQVKKAPIVTKPRRGVQISADEQELKAAQTRLAKTGSDRDALAVMKLQRKIKRR